MALLEIRGLKKSYAGPDGARQAILDVPAFGLEEKAQVGLRGQSGSGKTTLLHLIAGILTPDAGSVRIAGTDISALSEPKRDRFRAMNVGYIFQTFNLLQGFSCLENVLLSMAFGAGEDRGRATALLERVGLRERLHYTPRQLSTGQQQRAAIARALANRPRLVLADEPTGNLDTANGREALRLIQETCRESGAALLLVSHDADVLGVFANVFEFETLNRAQANAEANR